MLKAEIASLTEQDISPARAKEAIEVSQAIGRADLAAKLSASMGSEFGGVWFDPAAARLHIGVTSPRSQRAAERAVRRSGLSGYALMTPVPSRWSQLTATQERWNRRLARLLAREEVETALAPRENAVIVTLGSAVPVRERATIEHDAASSAVAVLVDAVRAPRLGLVRDANVTNCNKFVEHKAYCDKPITPAVTIQRKGGRCTAGPLVIPSKDKQRTYLLTAGHCVNDSLIREKWFSYTREGVKLEIGKSGSYRVKPTGDVGVVIVNRPGAWTREGNTPVYPVTAEWLKNAGTSFPVVSQKAPMEGDSDCLIGQTTGGKCGTVSRVGVTIGGVEKIAETNVTGLRRGDSGGPVIVETEGDYAVEGTIIGNTVLGQAVFEPLERAFTLLKSLSLELLTTANEVRPAESAEEKTENEKIEKIEKEEQEQREKEEKEDPLISPAPTSSAPLEFTATSGKAIFETTGSSKIECKEGTASGKFEAVREGEATLTMHGCKTILGIGCKTSGQAAETMSMVSEVELVDLEKTSLTLGAEVELAEPKVECGATSAVIEGTAIGEVTGVASGSKTKTATIVFKQTGGKQAIQECHLTKTFCENGPFILDTTINSGNYSGAFSVACSVPAAICGDEA